MNKKLLSSAILGLGFILVAPSVLAVDQGTEGKVKFNQTNDPGNNVILPDTEPPVVVQPGPGTGETTTGTDGTNFTVPNLDFGERSIVMEDRTYSPKSGEYLGVGDNAGTSYYLPPTVIVRDLRGLAAGAWTMSVGAGEFIKTGTESDPEPKIIKGASLTINDPRVFSNNDKAAGEQEVVDQASGFTFANNVPLDLSTGDQLPIISAKGGAGNMQTTYMLDQEKKYTVDENNTYNSTLVEGSEVKGIDLLIPGAAAIDTDEYTSTLTWTMISAPEQP